MILEDESMLPLETGFGISHTTLCGELLRAFYCPLRLGKGNMEQEREAAL